MDFKNLTIEDVKKDDILLQKILNQYNSYCKYKEKNREKMNQYSRDYYYKINNKEPKKEKNKTEDIKAYQKEYREKMKQKRQQPID